MGVFPYMHSLKIDYETQHSAFVMKVTYRTRMNTSRVLDFMKKAVPFVNGVGFVVVSDKLLAAKRRHDGSFI